MEKFIPSALGWIQDLPDPRDYSPDHPEIKRILDKLPTSSRDLPRQIDLRSDCEGEYFTPPRHQKSLNSSTAFACLALIEYFKRKIEGHTFNGSALFVYQMTRKLSELEGNAGIGIRSTLKAIRRYGVPPEEMYPYKDCAKSLLANDISLLGFHLHDLTYFRLDTPNSSGQKTLDLVRSYLAAGIPIVFGFSVPHSLTGDEIVPYRPKFDAYRGGQSVIAVGYDDHRLPGKQGALLIRSSWGTEWGKGSGHGWLPYSYVRSRLARDFWTFLRDSFVQSKELFRPPIVGNNDSPLPAVHRPK